MRKRVDMAYGPHPANRLDLYLPDAGTFDVMVYIHGGGLEGGDKALDDAFGAYVTARGVVSGICTRQRGGGRVGQGAHRRIR